MPAITCQPVVQGGLTLPDPSLYSPNAPLVQACPAGPGADVRRSRHRHLGRSRRRCGPVLTQSGTPPCAQCSAGVDSAFACRRGSSGCCGTLFTSSGATILSVHTRARGAHTRVHVVHTHACAWCTHMRARGAHTRVHTHAHAYTYACPHARTRARAHFWVSSTRRRPQMIHAAMRWQQPAAGSAQVQRSDGGGRSAQRARGRVCAGEPVPCDAHRSRRRVRILDCAAACYGARVPAGGGVR